MSEVVRIEILVAPETARALAETGRAEVVGRLVDGLVRPTRDADPLIAVLSDTRRAARESGLSDDDIDAELEAYRAERRG